MHAQRLSRVLLADQREILREAMKNYLQFEANLKVVGEASNSEEVLVQIQDTRPDLIIVKSDLPDQPVTDLIGEIKSFNPQIKIIVLGIRPDRRKNYLSIGADDFVSQSHSPKKLLTAIRTVNLEDKDAK